MRDNMDINRNRFPSPASTNRSRSSKQRIKIRIPKNSKLQSFFHKGDSKFEIEGKNKIIHQNSRKGLAEEIQSPRSCTSNYAEDKQDKDESCTRSRITVMEEYGFTPNQPTNEDLFKSTKSKNRLADRFIKTKDQSGIKNSVLLNSRDKKIQNNEAIKKAKEKIKFPFPGRYKEKRKKSIARCFSTPSLEFTFGIEGLNIPLRPKIEKFS